MSLISVTSVTSINQHKFELIWINKHQSAPISINLPDLTNNKHGWMGFSSHERKNKASFLQITRTGSEPHRCLLSKVAANLSDANPLFRCVSIPSTYPGEFVHPSVRSLVPHIDFHFIGVSGPWQNVPGPRDVVYFPKAMTNSFQIFFCEGGV